jgi:hypothetical protein
MDTRRPRVLVAGSDDAIEMVRGLIGADVELSVARSVEEACAQLGAVDLVICNLRFHESRLFDFLRLVVRRPRARRVPVICCRNRLSWYGERSVRLALRELGVDAFVDVALLERRAGRPAAAQALRSAVLSRLRQR